MSELINSQICIAQMELKDITKDNLSEDKAFSHILLKYCFDVDYSDQICLVTDGSNDGGIDFLYYDEEESKIILCQSKYTNSLSSEQIMSEFNKMYNTIQDFKSSNTGIYNERLKLALQNAIDRLPDDNQDNYEYHLFTTAPIDIQSVKSKIETSQHSFPADSVSIFITEDIEKSIQQSLESLPTVVYDKVRIDRPRNILEYESTDSKGIMCNVISKSIISLYNKYAGRGLFDLNIRRYIRNTLVDSGIKKTLDNNRGNFWFLNNGIIIACENYEVDGNTIKLTNFSIVNGGQTTTLIGKYKGDNSQDFYIPCKIVAAKSDSRADIFFTKIAEATNSQKPILARDLKSNAPEMVSLYNWLKNKGIYLEIKRGFKPKFRPQSQIKNDELGQLILSFAYQRPGTARSGKKVIFENQAIYDQIFKVNYMRDQIKSLFLLDLIGLKNRYDTVEKDLKKSLSSTQLEVLRNGRQTIFAIMGMCYRLANGDITEQDINENAKSLGSIPFQYGPILTSYRNDDIDAKFGHVVMAIVDVLSQAYSQAYDNKTTTSVSNFMKTDVKYYNEIVPQIIRSFKYMAGKDLKENIDLFKR